VHRLFDVLLLQHEAIDAGEKLRAGWHSPMPVNLERVVSCFKKLAAAATRALAHFSSASCVGARLRPRPPIFAVPIMIEHRRPTG